MSSHDNILSNNSYDTIFMSRILLYQMRLLASALVVALAAVLTGALLLLSTPRASIPAHLLHHPLIYTENFIPPAVGAELLELIKTMRVFPTNAADTQFYRTLREDIGEAVPLTPTAPNSTGAVAASGASGRCEHPFLIPNKNRTACVLPGRVDVARHFITTGGPDGVKESYSRLLSRVQSFGRYMFDLDQYPVVQALFASESFKRSAQGVCPVGKRYLDPFQFNFIMQVPGQTVAMHIDAPYFWGATRFEFPQWLLAVMVFSGLFQDRFVDQVQIVGYLHQWQPSPERQGEFVYWDTEADVPLKEGPVPLAGSAVDGSKLVHAAAVYRPADAPPRMDKSKGAELRYRGSSKGGDNKRVGSDDVWDLMEGERRLASYSTDDLRITIVYRARCFKDAAEAERFRKLPQEDAMSLEFVLSKLLDELIRRGAVTEADKQYYLTGSRGSKPAAAASALSEARLELAVKLLEEYVKYPLATADKALIPYNYCALGQLYPALSPVIALLCPASD